MCTTLMMSAQTIIYYQNLTDNSASSNHEQNFRRILDSFTFHRLLFHGPLHANVHWLDVPERTKYKLCMMVRRCQDGTAPQYLAAHLAPVSETASRQHLCSAVSHQLTVPSHRRTTYDGRAFAVTGLST